ncbi:MAG: TetR/AcrR family transcriptional regulator [Bacteroidota bacterium]|nr:TetR/AcrR family transcriptional regulator [Bacteroidota bacterium]
MTEKQDEKAKLIINSARKLFSVYGFKKTTMDEIALGAGKAKSSLYYYFASKEDVFTAVVEQESELLNETMQKAISKHNNSIDQLREYVYIRLKSINTMTNYSKALRDDILSNYVFISKIRKKYYIKEMETVTAILENGVKNEKFEMKDIHLSARALVTIIKGIEIPLTIDRQKKNLKKEVDDLMDIVFYGIVAR